MELEFKDVCRSVERAVTCLKSKEPVEERCLYLLHLTLLFYYVNPQVPRDYEKKDFDKIQARAAFKEYLIFVFCSSKVSFVSLPGDPDKDGLIPQDQHEKYSPDIFNCLQENMSTHLVFHGKKINVTADKLPVALHFLKHIRKHEAEKITEDRIKFIRSKIEEGQTEFTEWAIQLSDMCDWIIISKMTLTKYIINWHKKSTKTDRLEKTDPKDVVINGTTLSSPPSTLQITSILRNRGFSNVMNMNRQASEYKGCFLYHLEGGQFCPIHDCIHDSRGNQQYVVWNPASKDLSLKCLRRRDDDRKQKIKLL